MLPDTVTSYTGPIVLFSAPIWTLLASLLYKIAGKQLFPFHMLDGGWYKFILTLSWFFTAAFLVLFGGPMLEVLVTGKAVDIRPQGIYGLLFPIVHYGTGIWFLVAANNLIYHVVRKQLAKIENENTLPVQPPIPPVPEPEPPKLTIPTNLRTRHHWCVAPPGWGKSQLFQSMVLDDLETDAAIIVIDSQNDLINNLATRIDGERLILIDPVTCPPAFNVFAGTTANLTSRVALLTYALSAIGAEMTSKQQGMFDYLCRYLLSKPSTMGDFLEALHNPASIAGLADMGPVERAFYTEYANPKGEYRDSRGEVARRLQALLADKTLQTMLMADEMSIDIGKALDSGKVILINTAKSFMGQKQAMLFGRLWIAQILQAVMQREGTRRRTYMYIDEYADYASDDPILLDLFRQSRKFELGMIVAHQTLSDLPAKLRDVMLGTTAIKMCGGVSAADANVFAKQMRVEPRYIEHAKEGIFATHMRDKGFGYFPVEFGRLEKVPRLTRLKQIQEEMRELYGPKSRPPETPPEPPTPPPVSPKNPITEPPAGQGREGKGFNVDDQ